MLDALPPAPGPSGTGLADFVPLASELCDLKRVRDAGSPDSLASRMFRRGWGALAAGQDPVAVAMTATADALAACRLGGIDAGVLGEVGLSAGEAAEVLGRGFDEVAGCLGGGPGGGGLKPTLRHTLRDAVGGSLVAGVAPGFAEALIRQPRAGATCPGRARIVLEPPEGHGDHCFVVAVLGCVMAPLYGADPAAVFLAGMAHHLHNAVLPDSGFAGEVLLGAHLTPVIERLFARALATLAPGVRERVEGALRFIADAETPEGRAFHAADVVDRVLQMRHYEDVAGFRLSQALGDMELVHAGPVQAFHHGVLRDAGLM